MKNKTRCALCGSNDYEVICEKAGSKIGKIENVINVICNRCGLIYNNPIEEPDEFEGYYKGTYAEYNHLVSDYETLLMQIKGKSMRLKELGGMIVEFAKPFLKGEVLEIGCSAGFLLKEIEKEKCNIEGIEPNPLMVRIAREYNKLDVKNIFLKNYETDKKFDFIILQHVFEHLSNPNEVLENLKLLLKEDGYMNIGVPIASNFKPSLTLVGGLTYGHIFTYTPNTLRQLLFKHGLKVVKWAFVQWSLQFQVIATRIDNSVDCVPIKELEEGSDIKWLKRRLKSQNRRNFRWRIKRKIKTLLNGKWRE